MVSRSGLTRERLMETIKSLEKSNGSLKIPFGRGKMYRNSTAWHPDTGEAVRNHVPRITENKIPVFNFEPEVFYTFTEPEIFMDYASGVPQGTSKWMTGTGGRQEEFENAYPQFEKLIFGQSEEELRKHREELE